MLESKRILSTVLLTRDWSGTLTEVSVGGIGRDTWHFFFSLVMTFQHGRPLEGFFSHVDLVISHSVYFNLIPCSIT